MQVEKALPAQAAGLPRVYATPRLTYLGTVTELTAAGCGGSNESASQFCKADTQHRANARC